MNKLYFIMLMFTLSVVSLPLYAQEEVEPVLLDINDYNAEDIVNWEINIFSLPAFLLAPNTFRHIIIAVKTNDGKIMTKSLYPEKFFEVSWGLLMNNEDFRVDAVIKTNHDPEVIVVKRYYNKEKLPFYARHEYEVEIPDGENAKIFIERIFKTINSYPVVRLLDGYNALYGPNSNTFVDDVLETSGVQVPDISRAIQQNWGE